jgi:general secretion pathway protein A
MYVNHYELSGRPFHHSADPRFYFESATHRKAMSYLGYGLAQGEGFIVITGNDGAGKSTLVAQLMATIDPQRLAAVRIDGADLDGEALLRLTAHAFGIATDEVERRHVLSRIEAYMHHQARAGRRSLLIIDEAQALSLDALDALRQLSNFQLGGQSLVQIFLLGRTEFRDLIRNAPELDAVRQRIIASHHLEPLHAEEVRPYLEHRLKVVGWLGRPALTPQAVALLGQASGGVPAQLNALAGKVLERAAQAAAERIDETLVAAVCQHLGAETIMPPVQAEAPPAKPALRAPDAPVAPQSIMPQAVTPQPVEPQPVSPQPGELQAMREHVHDLQSAISQTVAETQAARTATLAQPQADALLQRLAHVEARLAEQDELLRQILAKLIEWMDRDAAVDGTVAHRAA